MAFKKNPRVVTYYLFWLLDTLTFDQHILFFSEFFNGFSLAWYSTLKHNYKVGCISCEYLTCPLICCIRWPSLFMESGDDLRNKMVWFLVLPIGHPWNLFQPTLASWNSSNVSDYHNEYWIKSLSVNSIEIWIYELRLTLLLPIGQEIYLNL